MTPQDIETFKEYASSEIVRLMRLRLQEWIDVIQNRLLSADPASLQLIQGELRGLNAAKNLMDPSFQIGVVEKQKPAPEKAIIRPMIRNTERKKPEGASILNDSK